ncbi:hypothetical protein J4218_06825 [Candidatus Pacearchaeota archaeon]|nr:hypothetical protein [Candidatus Pacearchaeota archaeon]
MVNSEIAFGDERVEKDFLSLDNIKEKNLKEQIEKAFCNLEEDAFCGIQIPKKLMSEIKPHLLSTNHTCQKSFMDF